MFRTASKFLYGLAAFAFVGAIAYSIITSGQKLDSVDGIVGPLTLGYKGYVGDHLGYSVFIGLAVVSLALAIFLSLLHDADAEAQAQLVGMETVPEVPAPARPNYWPVVGAFSAAAVVVGLAVGSELFTLGMIGVVITLLEWAARAWSDRATGDPDVNQDIRNRLLRPIEVPVGAVLAIGLLVAAVSRILLALPKYGTYAIFGLVPAAILAFGALIVLRPHISKSVIAGVAVVAGLLLLVGGAWAAIHGEREPEKKEEGAAAVHRPAVHASAPTWIRAGH